MTTLGVFPVLLRVLVIPNTTRVRAARRPLRPQAQAATMIRGLCHTHRGILGRYRRRRQHTKDENALLGLIVKSAADTTNVGLICLLRGLLLTKTGLSTQGQTQEMTGGTLLLPQERLEVWNLSFTSLTHILTSKIILSDFSQELLICLLKTGYRCFLCMYLKYDLFTSRNESTGLWQENITKSK